MAGDELYSLNEAIMSEIDRLKEIVQELRVKCPWDRVQTHESLKPECIEEAAEVICGINILTQTGDAENLKEELGDLLLQVMFHACMAEEEGLFTLDDVARTVSDKMIRRHPHVFGDEKVSGSQEVLMNWEQIKAKEKEGRKDTGEYLPQAFEEAKELIERAKKRKGYRDKLNK